MSKSVSPKKVCRVKMRITPSDGVRRLKHEREILPHLKALQLSARKLTSNEMDAQDLVQETLLKAFRFWESYNEGSNCRAWLYRILKNTFISEHRVRSRRPQMINLDDLHDADLFDLSVCCRWAPNPEDIFHLTRVKHEVAAGLARLRREFRQTLLLYFWRGLSYKDIASEANLPLSTVRARMHRSKQMMRDQLGCQNERNTNNANRSRRIDRCRAFSPR